MGSYVVNKDAMIKLLNEYFPEANDFEEEIVPGAVSKEMKVGRFYDLFLLPFFCLKYMRDFTLPTSSF